MCANNTTPIVIDHGTQMCKAGFAGDDMPRAVFPSIVGVPRKMEHIVAWQYRDTYVGDEARPSTAIFNAPLPPLQHGIITNWDSIEKILFHIFYSELRLARPEDHPVLLTEIPLNPKYNREMLAQIMFEKFKCPAVYVCKSAVSSLYASGRVTGLVLESGHEVTHAVPVYEGYGIPSSTIKLLYGGRTITKHLWKAMNNKKDQEGSRITVWKEETVSQMKEKLCRVVISSTEIGGLSENYSTPSFVIKYELPDGRKINVGDEIFKCPEALFQPKLMDIDEMGIHEAVHKSIMTSDEDIQNTLFANIVLSGGNTLFEGLPQRLEHEMSSFDFTDKSEIKLNVVANEYRKYQSWIGGSIFASLPSFSQCWVSKEEYEESGPSIMTRRCF